MRDFSLPVIKTEPVWMAVCRTTQDSVQICENSRSSRIPMGWKGRRVKPVRQACHLIQGGAYVPEPHLIEMTFTSSITSLSSIFHTT